MSYIEKLAIANAYLVKLVGVGWNDLPDINSLNDCDSEEDVISACQARMGEDGFSPDLFN